MAQSLGHSLAMGPAPVPLALIGGLEEAALCTEGVCSTAAGGGFRRLQARSQHREVLLPTQGLAHSLGDLPLPDHLGEDRENTGQVTAAGGSPSRKPPGVAPGTTPHTPFCHLGEPPTVPHCSLGPHPDVRYLLAVWGLPREAKHHHQVGLIPGFTEKNTCSLWES